MTREEIIKYLNIIKAFFLGSEHQPISDAYFALDEAIKALKQKLCEDAISREKLIKDLNFLYNEEGFIKDTRAKRTIEVIKGQAPVNPQLKTGHWINRGGDDVTDENVECSACGKWRWGKTNYCPNCGAKMEREKSENNE